MEQPNTDLTNATNIPPERILTPLSPKQLKDEEERKTETREDLDDLLASDIAELYGVDYKDAKESLD